MNSDFKQFLFFTIGLILFVVLVSRINKETFQDAAPQMKQSDENLVNNMEDYIKSNKYINVFKPTSIFKPQDGSKQLSEYYQKGTPTDTRPQVHGLPPFDQLSRDFVPIRNLNLPIVETNGEDSQTEEKYYKEKVNNQELIKNVQNLYQNDSVMNGGDFFKNIQGFDQDDGYTAF
jgi:hypothetical protein